MNRLLILFLITLFSGGFPDTTYADVTVKVGIYNNEPLIFVDKDNKGKGIFADVIEYVASKEGWHIEYVPGSWQKCLSRLETGEIDILCTIAFSKDRDKIYDFSKENLLTNWGKIYTLKDSNIQAISDVSGKKVAILKNDIYQSAFIKLIENFGLECDLIEADDYHSVLDMVASEQADAGIVNRFVGLKFGSRYNVDESGVIFNPIKIHYAVSEGKNKELIATVDRYIKLLKEDEESDYYRSLEKWFEVMSPHRTFPPWVKWATTCTLGLMTFLFIGNHYLRSRVRAKTKELSIELDRREKTEKKLQDAYSIINRSPAVTFLWKNSEGWPVEFVSDNVTELFGYTTREFTSGQVLYSKTIHPNDLERVAKEVATASRRKEKTDFVHQPYRIISKNEKIRWLDDRTYIRRDDNGNITHYEGIVVDITDNMNAAEILRQNKEKLERSRKMESLGMLAGGVAHDLNNVLSGIVSYPELILMDLPKDSQLREPIKTIKASGHRMAAIVQDLLTVARGAASTDEPLNLNDLICEYLNSPEFKKLEHFHPQVAIKTALSKTLFNMGGSPIHVRKVVMNLVSNASEAIEGTGSVTISTMNRYIDRPLKGYEDVNIGEYVVLSVSDDGPGIPSGDLERIFEPFYTKKVLGRSGTGLGLTVVWNVVRGHKGHIDIKTDESGTTFDLYFPITREKISGKGSSIFNKDYNGNGESILIVDDVENQREITCKMLDTLNYKTKAVSSGEEAVEYMKDHTVDLILLDMIMDPGINGRQTYEQIVKIHPNQKAIIVSGFAETDDVKSTQKLGAGEYIKKPLTLERIGIAVKEEIEK